MGLWAVTTVALGGCSTPTPAAESAVSDSAGVRIVTSTGTSGAESGWRLSSRPIFRTGWRDDEPTFESVHQGVIRDDLSVVIADGTGKVVYVLGADGQVLHRLGGPGQGPGEFESLTAVVAGGGDSVFAQGRTDLALFVGGEFIRERRVDWMWRTETADFALEARTADGSFIMTPGSWTPYPRNGEWTRAPVLRVSADLEAVDTLVVVDHAFLRTEDDWNPIIIHGFSAIGGDRIIHGRNDRAEVSWYDLDGRLSQIARWDYDFREVSEDDWDTYVRAMRAQGAGVELSGERFESMLAGQKGDFRGSLPQYAWLLADAVGNVWLAGSGLPGVWPGNTNIISATGEWLGAIEWPERTIPIAITDTHWLGVEKDEWDIQAIVLYEIIKPERR